MCQKESWGAIFATKEAHSTQRGQPPRMHGPGLWRHQQKEQRVTPVPMSGVNCDLWCPEWDSKDHGGRPEQDPGYIGVNPGGGGGAPQILGRGSWGRRGSQRGRVRVVKYYCI